MSQVYDDFLRELDVWEAEWARDARAAALSMLLLGLEREEIVAVSYQEEATLERIEALPLDPEVREVVAHAIRWIWREEEMHTIYVRGVLFGLGGLELRQRALVRQVGGALGGWASATSSHRRWLEAPLAVAVARAVILAGRVTGRVPRAVAEELDSPTFREFCVLQVEAERTAALAWERLAAHARKTPEHVPVPVAALEHLERDESSHARAFEILRDALDASDHLVPGASADTLSTALRAIDEHFVPRARRSREARGPIGRGGEVRVVDGRPRSGTKCDVLAQLLETSQLCEVMDEARARTKGPVLRVAIKASFMLAYDRRDRSHVADAALLDALARWLRAHGATDVAVLDGRNLYEEYFEHRDVESVARYLGLTSDAYRIVDASSDDEPHVFARGMGISSLSRTWRDADVRVSFTKLRSHPTEHVYLSIAELSGVSGTDATFLFAERSAHSYEASVAVADACPPDFAIVDGYELAADGFLGIMGCVDPPSPGRIWAGRDALAVDLVAARHAGMEDPRTSAVFEWALAWLGDPRRHTVVVGPDTPLGRWRTPRATPWYAFAGEVAFPAFSLTRGSFFLPAMDQSAFPLREPARAPLRAVRALMRRLGGLGEFP